MKKRGECEYEKAHVMVLHGWMEYVRLVHSSFPTSISLIAHGNTTQHDKFPRQRYIILLHVPGCEGTRCEVHATFYGDRSNDNTIAHKNSSFFQSNLAFCLLCENEQEEEELLFVLFRAFWRP